MDSGKKRTTVALLLVVSNWPSGQPSGGSGRTSDIEYRLQSEDYRPPLWGGPGGGGGDWAGGISKNVNNSWSLRENLLFQIK